jgi:hypothetical protein
VLLGLLQATVKADISVTAPSRRETLQAHKTYRVRWTATERTPVVTFKLLLGSRDELVYQTNSPVYATSARRGHWYASWRVPLNGNRGTRSGRALAGGRLKLRIEAPSGEYGDSAVFTIGASSLAFETFTLGALREPVYMTHQKSIRWRGHGTRSRIRLSLYRRGVRERIGELYVGNLTDNFRWTVGTEISYVRNNPGHGYYLKLESLDRALSAETPPFQIVRPTLRVTYPNGGRTLRRDRRVTISWSSRGLAGPVKLELWQGNRRVYTIRQSTRNDWHHRWTVFPRPPFGVGEIWSDWIGVRLRITSVVMPQLYDECDAPFNISS